MFDQWMDRLSIFSLPNTVREAAKMFLHYGNAINLSFDGGGGVVSIRLFEESFSQPKLGIFRGV